MGGLPAPVPDVSFIICHHVGRKLFEQCLESVYQTQSVKYEVIVITSDATLFEDVRLFNEIHHWTIRCVYEEGGPAHKRNVGVRHALATTLIFLDDDVEISPYCAYAFVEGFRELPKAGMLFAKILKMDRREVFDDCGAWITSTGFLWNRATNDQTDIGQYDTPTKCLSGKSATCAIRRDIFIRAGGFDASYYILGEETQLAWRVWLLGLEVWYWPRAKSWHAFGTKFKPKATYYTLERIHFHGCKNYLSLLWTNLGAHTLAITLPLHLFAWLISAMGFLLRGQWRRSLLIMRGMYWCATHLSDLQRKRRAVQSTRTISDHELMRIVKYSPPLWYYPDRLWRYLIQGLHG